MQATEYARTAEVSEFDIRRAARAAATAQAKYVAHDRYCRLWERDLTCPTCAQLFELAEQSRRFAKSLASELLNVAVSQ